MGSPREWVFSHYWKNGRTPEGSTDSARDHRYRLYSDGRMYDVLNDVLETNHLPESGKTKTTRKKLHAAIELMQTN
jgi:arylsulfatase A